MGTIFAYFMWENRIFIVDLSILLILTIVVVIIYMVRRRVADWG